MATELKVPPAGESITEVQIGEWLKKEGDAVKRDETIVVIETDKVTVELPAPADGVITKIVLGEGEDASVGDVIGFFEEGAVASPAKEKEESPKDKSPEGKASAEAKTAGPAAQPKEE